MTQVDLIKEELANHIGKRVILKANKGRKKIVTKQGVLTDVYPSLFVVNINNEEAKGNRMISYTYSDVLTATVQITILEEESSENTRKIS